MKSMKIKVQGVEYDAKVRVWQKSDLPQLKTLFNKWSQSAYSLKEAGGRQPNFPEMLSEGIFCVFTGSVQVVKITGRKKGGIECYDLSTKKTQQIKASSNIKSPSSFGHYSDFDEVHWMILHQKGGKFTGEFSLYKIPRDLIVGHPNFARLAPKGKRPRFPLLGVVKKHSRIPYLKGTI